MANMAMARFEHVIITVQNERATTREEFEQYLKLAKELRAEVGDVSRISGLNFTDGGTPTSSQRQQLKDLFEGKNPRAAIVTDSRVARGVAVIFSWFAPGFAAFAPERWREAVAHAGLSEAHLAKLVPLIRELKAQVGEVRATAGVLASGPQGG